MRLAYSLSPISLDLAGYLSLVASLLSLSFTIGASLYPYIIISWDGIDRFDSLFFSITSSADV
jgi:hypothetical protein